MSKAMNKYFKEERKRLMDESLAQLRGGEPSASVRLTNQGNLAYDLTLPSGRVITVTSLDDEDRIRIDGPEDMLLLVTAVYPGGGEKPRTRVAMSLHPTPKGVSA